MPGISVIRSQLTLHCCKIKRKLDKIAAFPLKSVYLLLCHSECQCHSQYLVVHQHLHKGEGLQGSYSPYTIEFYQAYRYYQKKLILILDANKCADSPNCIFSRMLAHCAHGKKYELRDGPYRFICRQTGIQACGPFDFAVQWGACCFHFEFFTFRLHYFCVWKMLN